MKSMKIATIWLTGLSASGKSTLSENLYRDLKSRGVDNLKLLDGEAVREFFENFNYNESSREEIGNKKIELALDENKKGNIVIITGIAHQKRWREEARQKIKNYYEIYLNASARECAQRDFKDNYRKAYEGALDNFIGVSEKYEESNENVDLVVDSGKESIEYCSDLVAKHVLEFLEI